MLTLVVVGVVTRGSALAQQLPPKPKPDSTRPAMAGMRGMETMQMRDSARVLGMADQAMSGMGGMDTNMARHMRMTPRRVGTRTDSARAAKIVNDLRVALARYTDTSAAVRDGYKQFLPNVKNQKVYHFTNDRLAFMEAFRFDPAKPTSLLYQPQVDGKLKLIGAMYTAPKRYSYDQLDARIPLGVAQWHQHVNWCLPPEGKQERWLDKVDGAPLFGPESPVATATACEKVGGEFHPVLFNWMVHANVFLSDDPRVIWGDEHGKP